MGEDHKDRVDWVVPGNGDILLGADSDKIIDLEKQMGHSVQPTQVDPATGKVLRGRVDKIVVKGMPAPQSVKPK